MSDLTPEEQRAVEAACANWADACTDKVEREVYTRVRAEGYGDESAQAAVDYAQGYLDGYRRGVEAAMAQVGCPDREASVFDSDLECAQFDIRDRIRALLAQEESRG